MSLPPLPFQSHMPSMGMGNTMIPCLPSEDQAWDYEDDGEGGVERGTLARTRHVGRGRGRGERGQEDLLLWPLSGREAAHASGGSLLRAKHTGCTEASDTKFVEPVTAATIPSTTSQSVHQDPLGDWLVARQRAFRDFDRSWQTPSVFQGDTVRSILTTPSWFSSSDHAVRPPNSRVNSSPFTFSSPSHSYRVTYPHQSVDDSQPSLTFGGSDSSPAKITARPPTATAAMLSTRNENADLSPKAKVSYDEDKFQVELDVQDYRPEELSIKTEGDVLVVLAKHETKTETGGSFVSKQFEQRFTLPAGVKPESISSSLSKNGTLTVSAPREMGRSDLSGFKSSRPLTSESASNKSLGNVYAQSTDQQGEGLPHPKVKYDEDKFQISLDCQHYKPEELDVKVEGNSIIITAKQEVKESGGTRTRVFEQKFSLPSGVKAEKVASSISRDGVLTITAPRGNTHSSSMVNQSSIESHRSSFFPTVNDGISKIQCDDESYKILINVKDFKPEELVIKTVGNTVHFEAKHEEKTADGLSSSSRNISQSFTLPRGVDPESVSSSMSKEGVLTISAPLPAALKALNAERVVQIKHH
eukprot:TCALIF_05434-PA protein Name:"Similar to HSPB1 Heat shock protein beta-1 (Bos taurus)" AED:0.19 eAED:0.19 QI:68/0/0/1/0/0/2/0/585